MLELRRPEVGDFYVEPAAHLPVRVLRKANCARFRNPLQPRGDIDAVAHQIAVALLDHVAKMDADAELDAPVLGHAGVPLDHGVLNLDRAAHRVDDAAELDDAAVAGALDDAPMVHRDGRIDQIAAQRPEPRQDAILVRAREPAVADHIGDENRRDFSRFRHAATSGVVSITHAMPPARLSIECDRVERVASADRPMTAWARFALFQGDNRSFPPHRYRGGTAEMGLIWPVRQAAADRPLVARSRNS